MIFLKGCMVMLSKYICFFMVLFTGFLLAANERTVTIWDLSGGNMYWQDLFGRVFADGGTTLPQDILVNIANKTAGEIKNIPPDTIVSDDGMSGWVMPNDCEKSAYACQAVLLAVGLENPLDDVDTETLKRIYSGRVGDWSRIGGKAGKIILAGYPEASAVGRVFRKKAMQQDLLNKEKNDISTLIAPDMIVCNSGDAAAALLQTSGSVIAFGGADLAGKAQNKFKILKVNGVYPSRENILSGKYALAAVHSVAVSKKSRPAAYQEIVDFLKKSTPAEMITLK